MMHEHDNRDECAMIESGLAVPLASSLLFSSPTAGTWSCSIINIYLSPHMPHHMAMVINELEGM